MHGGYTAWIESHDDIWEHHKTVKLCALLNITDVQAVGHLMSLWHFVLRNAWHDADLEPWGELGAERAAKWTGEQGLFIKSIRSAGYIDGFVVHGWIERAGKLVTDRIYNEERRKNATLRRKPVATLPNPTLPNPTQPKDMPRSFKKPELDEVKAYCLERKNKVDPQHFIDYNEARGWMIGKSRMKDWKATIRTWEKNDFNSAKNRFGATPRVVGAAAPMPGKYDHLD
jgi:hypothetical protein